MQGPYYLIFWGDRGARDIVWAEFDSVAYGNCLGFLCEDTVATVVGQGWANVEPVLCAHVPRAAEGRLGVYLDCTSCRSQWRGIEVEVAKESFPGGGCRPCRRGAE